MWCTRTPIRQNFSGALLTFFLMIFFLNKHWKIYIRKIYYEPCFKSKVILFYECLIFVLRFFIWLQYLKLPLEGNPIIILPWFHGDTTSSPFLLQGLWRRVHVHRHRDGSRCRLRVPRTLGGALVQTRSCKIIPLLIFRMMKLPTEDFDPPTSPSLESQCCHSLHGYILRFSATQNN